MFLNNTIEYFLNKVFTLDYLIECYELRIKLARENFINKSEYEKNEIELLIAKTTLHKLSAKDKLKSLNQELQDLYKIYMQELKELSEK